MLKSQLAEDKARWIRGPVVHALQRRTFSEKDQPRCIVGQKAYVARVTLFLESRDQAREVDERRLERVIDDLPSRYRDRFAPVLGLWPVLHAASWLGCFH